MKKRKLIYVFNPEDVESNRKLGALAIFPFLFVIYFLTTAQVKSLYLRYCANQGIIFTIFYIAANFLGAILGAIPFVGRIIAVVIAILQVAVLALTLYQCYKAYKGEAKPLPFIGDIEILRY